MGPASGIPMEPVDGAWGGFSEVVTATVPTGSLGLSQHILLVHGRNDVGNWGPLTAVFVQVKMYDVYLLAILRG
jgi:carboxypeptidase T